MLVRPSFLQFPAQLKLVTRFVAEIFPRVDQELIRWGEKIKILPDEILQAQARASILSKRFHAQGGSIYALYPGADQQKLIPFIVALQTISDYLDNLCDRTGIEDEQAFRQIHLAMTEALQPAGPISDYYCYYPQHDDGGYLQSLVEECRFLLAGLPSYDLVQEHVVELAGLYSELQTYKHLPIPIREHKLIDWSRAYLRWYPSLSPWEFGAATGSTLGIFILCAAASNPNLSKAEVVQIKEAYFPWITALHILLDYFIDQDEDLKEGDLNFVAYYQSREDCSWRLSWFLQKSLAQAISLPHPLFHLTVIQGLLAMYLSDPKTGRGEIGQISGKLITSAGTRTIFLHRVCCLLRQRAII